MTEILAPFFWPSYLDLSLHKIIIFLFPPGLEKIDINQIVQLLTFLTSLSNNHYISLPHFFTSSACPSNQQLSCSRNSCESSFRLVCVRKQVKVVGELDGERWVFDAMPCKRKEEAEKVALLLCPFLPHHSQRTQFSSKFQSKSYNKNVAK